MQREKQVGNWQLVVKSLRLNFSNSSPQQIEEGISRLARVQKESKML
jgi:DNA-binding transcriptional MocR family regulator